MSDDNWGLSPGEEICPGRTAVRRLGGGVRFEAWLAWDETLFAAVVVKVLRPSHAVSRRALRALARESDLAGRLGHPSLVRAFGAQLDGPRPHLVLEFLDGPRLSTLLRRHGPLPLEQALPLGLELCSVLHYLAASGVVHLDVKPSNVVMGSPPRLIDLSLARSVEAARELVDPVGTEGYMAPEQSSPQQFGPAGPPADVWGLGSTLYEALAGRLPFAPSAVTKDHPAPLPASVPPALSAAVYACLDPVPAARPLAAEVAGLLEPLIAALPRPVLAGFLPTPRRERSRTRRR